MVGSTGRRVHMPWPSAKITLNIFGRQCAYVCASKQTLACQSDSVLVNTTLFFTSSVWVCPWVKSKQVCEVSWQVCAVSRSSVSTEPLVAFRSCYRHLWPLPTSSPHSLLCSCLWILLFYQDCPHDIIAVIIIIIIMQYSGCSIYSYQFYTQAADFAFQLTGL